jgi:hypothetical protein
MRGKSSANKLPQADQVEIERDEKCFVWIWTTKALVWLGFWRKAHMRPTLFKNILVQILPSSNEMLDAHRRGPVAGLQVGRDVRPARGDARRRTWWGGAL